MDKKRNVIGGFARINLIEKPQTLLRKRQRKGRAVALSRLTADLGGGVGHACPFRGRVCPLPRLYW